MSRKGILRRLTNRGDGRVHRKLLVVLANAVALSISVSKHTSLKGGILGGANAGRHVRGVKADLLDLLEVVGPEWA